MAIRRETAKTFKGIKRNAGRTCVSVKTDTKGDTLYRSKKVTFKDSGVRFAGCFSSPAKAKARVEAIKDGRFMKGKGKKRKSSKRGRRKK